MNAWRGPSNKRFFSLERIQRSFRHIIVLKFHVVDWGFTLHFSLALKAKAQNIWFIFFWFLEIICFLLQQRHCQNASMKLEEIPWCWGKSGEFWKKCYVPIFSSIFGKKFKKNLPKKSYLKWPFKKWWLPTKAFCISKVWSWSTI